MSIYCAILKEKSMKRHYVVKFLKTNYVNTVMIIFLSGSFFSSEFRKHSRTESRTEKSLQHSIRRRYPVGCHPAESREIKPGGSGKN